MKQHLKYFAGTGGVFLEKKSEITRYGSNNDLIDNFIKKYHLKYWVTINSLADNVKNSGFYGVPLHQEPTQA